jgi:hypothetical protein
MTGNHRSEENGTQEKIIIPYNYYNFGYCLLRNCPLS